MSQQNLEVVRRGYEAFGRGDLDAMLKLYSPDAEWVTPGPPELPLAGTRRGPAEIAQFFGLLNELIEVQSFEVRTFVADGDHVVVLGFESSRFKPTGKVISFDWAHVFTLEDGRIVRFQDYYDTAAVVAELHASRQQA